MNFNQVTLAGRLTRDPELRSTKSGTQVANFDIATTMYRKDADPVPEYNSITVWGATAENVGKYLGKGDAVLVSGQLTTDTWETDNGEKRSKKKINAHSVQFGPKKGAGANGKDDTPKDSGGLDTIPF